MDVDACQEIFLSDICPVAEFNVHKCVTFDAVYWQPDIVIDHVAYPKGLSTHAPDPAGVPDPSCRFFAQEPLPPGRARASWNLAGYDRFAALLGLAEHAGGEPGAQSDGVTFRIYVDGVVRFDSGIVSFSTPPIPVAIDVTGGSLLVLEVDAGGGNSGDHSVWANARLRKACQP